MPDRPRPRIAVVGAGILGLVAGRGLARRGFPVDLYERWPDVGGQASAFDLGNGVWLDRYYHHLFESDREMIALHDELLPGRLEWYRSSVGMYARGRIWPFVTARDLLRYAPLPLPDRLRLGAAVLALSRRTDWERMDDVAAIDWLRRACGDRSLRSVWLPLLLGKFGDDAPTVPLAWLWSKLVLRRGKRAGREVLGYPRGSFREVCVALSERIREHGGSIHLDREVVAVERRAERYVLRCAAPAAYRSSPGTAHIAPGREAEADAILFTTPAHVTARLVDWPPSHRRRLEEWTYRSAVVLLLELRRPYSDTYWTNVGESDVPFLGLVEHTNLVPAERYPARYLYVSNYVSPDDPLARLDTDDLLAHYLPPLQRIRAGLRADDIVRHWSFREDAAQPVPRLGNRHRILPFETPLPRVFIANTTQIYPEDRGTNYSALLGRRVADVMASALQAS